MEKPLVSVIITTRNSASTLKALLQSIKRQTYKQIELIVVDNYSSDNTEKIARHFTNNFFLLGPERSAQRNYGANKSSGEYLLFLDSDMVLEPEVVGECTDKLIENPEYGAVVIPEKSFGKGFWAKAKALERDINQGEEYFEAARFFPKKVFLEFGGYDENLTGPEDWEFPQRVSERYQICRINRFILHDEGEPDLFKLAKRKYYYGLSAHNYLKKHGIGVFTTKTIYFMRPAFYRQWKTVFDDPFVYLGMLIMLFTEMIGGGLGYLVGRVKNAG